jgi:hypothetical protein
MTDPVAVLVVISMGFFALAANSRRLAAWSERAEAKRHIH